MKNNIELFSRITFLDKLLFTKHLSMMIKSGITIVEALDILASQSKSSAFKKLIASISDDIRNGKNLADSLKKHPKVFNSLYVGLVEVGESSGSLDENLVHIASQLSKEYAFRKKVKGALMYPCIVLSAALIVGAAISIFVLPKLLDLFQGFDAKLPLTTQLLIGFAHLMQNYGILIGILLVVGFFFLRFLIATRAIKPLWDNFLLRLPLFGSIIQGAELSTFCRSMGIMVKSGLPITNALDVESGISKNLVIQQYVKKMSAALNKGRALATELESGGYSLFPPIATKMIGVGEKTGKIDETFLYLAQFFEDDVDDATQNLSTILEPVLLLVIGVIVAFVALAIISPIYQLTGSIKR